MFRYGKDKTMFMLETLFLISLGITFLLILLLIYHFKNRLAGLEQKHEVLLEILNTLVQETHMLKAVVGTMWRPPHVVSASTQPIPEFSKEAELEELDDDLEELDDDLEDNLEELDDELEEEAEEEDPELLEEEELELEEEEEKQVEKQVEEQVDEQVEEATLDKMKLSELRALVTQRGLSTEAAKLKKQQLLDLLTK